MQETWKLIAAAALDIFGAFAGLIAALLEYMQGPNAGSISWALSIVGVVVILPLLAGISSLNRKRWWLAIVGSIPAILALVGIPAIILIAQSRKEFK